MIRIIIILSLFLSITFAIKPVMREDNQKEKSSLKIEIPKTKDLEPKGQTEIEIKNIDKEDQFQDVDSNNVNDQREDDLLKIKQLKTKFKDLFKGKLERKKTDSKKREKKG
uniref:Uncharacterized protein n=1 Tax=candidate division WOR-3 bacterium TaxID=2052148 RepID=A0A7C4X8W8_UNCW3